MCETAFRRLARGADEPRRHARSRRRPSRTSSCLRIDRSDDKGPMDVEDGDGALARARVRYPWRYGWIRFPWRRPTSFSPNPLKHTSSCCPIPRPPRTLVSNGWDRWTCWCGGILFLPDPPRVEARRQEISIVSFDLGFPTVRGSDCFSETCCTHHSYVRTVDPIHDALTCHVHTTLASLHRDWCLESLLSRHPTPPGIRTRVRRTDPIPSVSRPYLVRIPGKGPCPRVSLSHGRAGFWPDPMMTAPRPTPLRGPPGETVAPPAPLTPWIT